MNRSRLACLAGLVLVAASPSFARAESEMHQSPLLVRSFDPPVTDALPGRDVAAPSAGRRHDVARQRRRGR